MSCDKSLAPQGGRTKITEITEVEELLKFLEIPPIKEKDDFKPSAAGILLGPSTGECALCQEPAKAEVKIVIPPPINLNPLTCIGCRDFILIPELEGWLNQAISQGVVEVDEFDLGGEPLCQKFFDQIRELPQIKLGGDFCPLPKTKVRFALVSETVSGRAERIKVAYQQSVYPPIALPEDIIWQNEKERELITQIEKAGSSYLEVLAEYIRKEVLTS
jgi:hypothetical protein